MTGAPFQAKRRLVAIALGCAVLCACEKPVDTQRVQEYAKTFAAGASSFDDVAGDFAQSCVRIREYSDNSAAFLRTRPVVQMTPAPNGMTPSTCALAASVSTQWKLRNAILEQYVQSLAAIAGVDTKPDGTDALGAALTNASIFSSTKASAFGDLVSTIVSIKLENDRDVELRRVVLQADPSVAQATESLASTAEGPYTTLLDDEEVVVDRFYQRYLRNAVHPNGDRLTILHVRQEWLARRNDVEARKQKALAYAASMRDLAKTDAALAKAAQSQASLSEMIDVVNDNVVPLVKDVSALASSGG
jgi:hypothetical protein